MICCCQSRPGNEEDVLVTEDTPPNPYLKDDPYRDLETTAGVTLTKLNPAYMTRQISDTAKRGAGGVSSHGA